LSSNHVRGLTLHPASNNGAAALESFSITPAPNGGSYPKTPGIPQTLQQLLQHVVKIGGENLFVPVVPVSSRKKKRKYDSSMDITSISVSDRFDYQMKKFGTYQELEKLCGNHRYSGSGQARVEITMFPFHSSKLYVDTVTKKGYIATTVEAEAAYKSQNFEEYQLVIESLNETSVGITRTNCFTPSNSSAVASSSSSSSQTFPDNFLTNLPSTYKELIEAYEVGVRGLAPIHEWTANNRSKWDKSVAKKSNENFRNICRDYYFLHEKIANFDTVDGSNHLKDIRKESRAGQFPKAEEKAKEKFDQLKLVSKLML